VQSSPQVLLLTDADVWAGTERHMLDLAIALQAQGTAVFLSAPQKSVLHTHCKTHQIKFIPMEKNGQLDLRAIRHLARLLRTRKIDIIHAHNGRTQLSAAIAVTLARHGKVVFTQHFITPFHTQLGGIKAQVYRWVHAAISKKTERVVAISEAVQKSMLERYPAAKSKIVVVHNGINDPQSSVQESGTNVRKQWGVPATSAFFACAARLEQEKEISVLLEAFALVLKKHPEAQLRIAGEGNLERDLKSRIECLGIGQNVRLVGFLNDALSFFAAADVVVLPAPAEPFGLVFLEAMGLEKPVVACNGGAAPEIIIDGETGVLVTPSDPAKMAKAIETLIEQPENIKQFGKKGRERFLSDFTRERMAQKTLNIYREIWSSKA
jgi:glycosyltransferase involved in cell wall biosynthesis